MKNNFTRLFSVLIITTVLGAAIFAGCKKDQDGEAQAAPGAATAKPGKAPEPKKQGKWDFPELTSIEAAQLAYSEAKKWRSDAVLWYMSPRVLIPDYRWAENDRSWEWAVIFCNPSDDKRYNVTIMYDRITEKVEETYVKRESPVLPNFPKDRPGVSMAQALQAALAAGAPKYDKPMFYYIIDNSWKKYRGRPVWEFTYVAQRVGYTVDGLTGQLLETRLMDLKSSQPITIEEIKKIPPSKFESMGKQIEMIYTFFENINAGKTDEAIAMLGDKFTGANKGAWKDNFSSLEKVRVKSVMFEEESLWSNGVPLFKVQIWANPKTPGQFGWEDGVNTRWFAVSTTEPVKILEYSTGP